MKYTNNSLQGIEEKIKGLENLKKKDQRKENSVEVWLGHGDTQIEEVIMMRKILRGLNIRRKEVEGSKDDKVRRVMERAAKTIALFPIPILEVDKIKEELKEKNVEKISMT